MHLRTNSDYFSIRHCLIDFINRGRVFTARYELGIQIKSYSFVLKGFNTVLYSVMCA